MQHESTLEKIEAKYRMLAPMMDERMRRQWAASEERSASVRLGRTDGLKASMHTILTVLSINIFNQVPLHELFMDMGLTEADRENPNQLVINF